MTQNGVIILTTVLCVVGRKLLFLSKKADVEETEAQSLGLVQG